MPKIQLISIDDVITIAKTYISNQTELDLIRKAYDFAAFKHLGQLRYTGEEYIQHPLNVASILTNIYGDCETLCAALLHDVLEDTETDEREIEELFGNEILKLVKGVTKIGQIHFNTETEKIAENQRKILVGLIEDVRVIIIKLADRLHNMRTLWALPIEKQKKIAKETLEILTPVAHRLGIHLLKSELEDLSLRHLKPDVFYDIVEKLNAKKVERDNAVKEMLGDVSNLLFQNNINHEIKGRAKSIYSIYKKLDKGRSFSDIYDLLALRILVETEAECYIALGLIHSKYKLIAKRFKDYIAMPKTNMYQSLHTTVFGIDGHLFEIQIRTSDMNRIAEYGIASHWSYKEGNKASMQDAMEQKLQFFRSLIELNKDTSSSEEFISNLKDDVLSNKDIYVYTPKGDVVELTEGCTPIDFAYKVHTKVGDKMVGAIVNDAIVPLDYQLKNGDIIKINTNNNSKGPSREWLNIAKTAQARNKIKSFFSKMDKDGNLKNGEVMLEKALRKRKIAFNDFMEQKSLDKVFKELKVNSLDDLYIGLGSNKFAPNQVINIFMREDPSEEDLLNKKMVHNKLIIKNDILVEGMDEIKVNLASCCCPIKGDRIVGYVTKGNGITVHRQVCHNIQNTDDRLIEVKWNDEIEKKYPTSILVECPSDNNSLIDIITKASSANIAIESIETVNRFNPTVYEIRTLVESKEKLFDYINSLDQLPYVSKVERVIK